MGTAIGNTDNSMMIYMAEIERQRSLRFIDTQPFTINIDADDLADDFRITVTRNGKKYGINVPHGVELDSLYLRPEEVRPPQPNGWYYIPNSTTGFMEGSKGYNQLIELEKQGLAYLSRHTYAVNKEVRLLPFFSHYPPAVVETQLALVHLSLVKNMISRPVHGGE